MLEHMEHIHNKKYHQDAMVHAHSTTGTFMVDISSNDFTAADTTSKFIDNKLDKASPSMR